MVEVMDHSINVSSVINGACTGIPSVKMDIIVKDAVYALQTVCMEWKILDSSVLDETIQELMDDLWPALMIKNYPRMAYAMTDAQMARKALVQSAGVDVLSTPNLAALFVSRKSMFALRICLWWAETVFQRRCLARISLFNKQSPKSIISPLQMQICQPATPSTLSEFLAKN